MLQLPAFVGEVEKTLPPVLCACLLIDKAVLDQLFQDATEALFSDAQDLEELSHRHARRASDKVDDPMMSPAKAVSFENIVRISGKIPVGKKQKLDPGAQLTFP